MALTRAQLLMGDTGLGAVLTGQVQGVRQGPGISIATDGTISVNSQTVTGLMKMGQTTVTANAAYNGFEWPTTAGAVGQQLTISTVLAGVTTLAWGDADGIPWTQKGQIVAATGAGSASQTLVNVGTDGQILIADSATASGLNYTSNYVATGGATTAAYMPAGNTLARPATPPAGSLRYNSTLTAMEFYNGTGWEVIASNSTGEFVEKTSATGSAIMPAGNTAARDLAPADGFTRFNTQTGSLEFYSSPNWIGVGGGIPDLGLNLNTTNSLLKAATPYANTPPAAGTAAGQAVNGSLYWDTEYGALFVRYTDANATSQWVMINGNNVATGALDFPAGPVGGATYAAPNGLTYTYDGTKGVWTCPAGGASVGLGLATNGGFIKVSIPVASTPPAAGTGQTQAMNGSMYWDDVLGALFIRYFDGVTTQWVQTTPSGGGGGGGTVTNVTGTLPITVATGGTTPVIGINAATYATTGSIEIATLAEAAAGTDATRAATPETSVPKDTAGMAGAALLPKGGNYAGATSGMFRFNTTSNHTEYYNGTAWQTSANRSGDFMSGNLDFGPTGFPNVSGGTAYGTTWSGTVSGNVPGYALGYATGGTLTLSRTGDAPLGLNRTDGIGSFINLYDANVLAGFVGKNASGWFSYQVQTSPLYLASVGTLVYIQGNDASGPVTFRDGGGNNIARVSNAGTFITISDENLKVNIEPLAYGLAEVLQLDPKSYKLKYQVEDDHGDAPTQLGFLAQEVEDVIPEVVDYSENEKGDTFCSIAYSELIPVLVNAIKELKQEFDDYKASHP